jgi:hypothetical protein
VCGGPCHLRAGARPAQDGGMPMEDAHVALAAALWPASWASAADNDEEDNKEELVPRRRRTLGPSTLLLMLWSKLMASR